MEGMLSSSEQQRLVSSFLEIAVGQTSETARQFLEVLLDLSVSSQTDVMICLSELILD